MLTGLKNLVADFMKVPPEPHDPMGQVGSLRVFRAAKSYLYYCYLKWLLAQLIFLGFLAAFFGGLLSDPTDPDRGTLAVICWILTAFFLIQFFISVFVVWLNYEMRWYKVTDRSLRIRYGVWNVREHTVTFANIQNISVTQGPLQRILGISDVKVDTAGGGGASAAKVRAGAHFGLIGLLLQSQGNPQMMNLHEAVFRGVDNGEEIRDLMMVRLRRVRDAGLGETVETAEPSATVTPPVLATPGSDGLLALLTALRQEASALRSTTEKFTG